MKDEIIPDLSRWNEYLWLKTGHIKSHSGKISIYKSFKENLNWGTLINSSHPTSLISRVNIPLAWLNWAILPQVVNVNVAPYA